MQVHWTCNVSHSVQQAHPGHVRPCANHEDAGCQRSDIMYSRAGARDAVPLGGFAFRKAGNSPTASFTYPS